MSKINSKIKDDFQVVLLLSCFVADTLYLAGGEGRSWVLIIQIVRELRNKIGGTEN